MSNLKLTLAFVAMLGTTISIALDQNHGLAYYMRGLNYSTKKDYSKAISDLEIASKLLRSAGNDRYAQSAEETLALLRVLKK
jgi:hypothetical protein